MSTENENLQNLGEDTEQNSSQNNEEEKKAENERNSRDFISEFAPEPIQIPKYNKEKEQKKYEKASEKIKKRNTKKSKKRRSILKKIVFVARTIVLFAVLFSVLFATLSSLIVRMNASQYSIESAIRTQEPERFIVGKIKSPSKINLKKSSPRASVADVLRDNALITVTYDDIEQAVLKSTYPDFVANTSYNIIRYFLHGKDFKKLDERALSEMLLKNVSYIKLVTGVELGESACKDIAKYILKSAAVKEISPESLKNQPATEYTYITSVVFSTAVLVCLVIALMLFIILTVVACNGFAHKMIGWAVMLAGASAGVLGFLYKPAFTASSPFIRCVVEAITKSFNQKSLICGIVVFLIGVLVMLIGHAMTDDEDYDEIEENEFFDSAEEALEG